MSKQIKEGSTDVSVRIRIIDSSDGTPETGVTSASGGLDLWYQKEGALPVDITESDLTALTDAHSDGGMKHINDGYYRLDVPDAAFTATDSVMIGGTVTGMIVIGTELQIVEYDPNDSVRLGLTALPNAAADAAGGLPISDAGGLDLDTQLANAVPTVGAISDGVWDEAFSGHTSAGTFGKLVKNLGEGVVAADGSVNDVSATVNTFITDLTETTTSHYSDLTLIFTSGNLKGQAKPIQSYNGTTKTIVLDEDLTEAPADTDTFLILSMHVHPISQIASSVTADIDANSTQLAAIVADTNEIQTDLADGGRVDLLVDGIKAVTDAIPDSGSMTSIAQASALTTVDTVVDGIKAVTDLLPDAGALSSIAQASDLATVDTNVDAILVDTSTTIPAQITAINAATANDILYTQLTESYAAAGAAPTVAQALLMIQQILGDFSITGSTLKVNKLDGVTVAANYTLNDPVNPTGNARSS